MYKREIFESMDALLDFLNNNKINERMIISIMPFQTCDNSGAAQLRREYEMIYKDNSNRSAAI